MLKNSLFAGALLAGLLISATNAVAHSKPETSFPAAGAVLDAPPEEIWVAFDMPITITMARLVDSAGKEHGLTRAVDMRMVERFEAAPAADLPPGQYSLNWRGLSDDGHMVEGKIAFEVK